MRRLWAAGVAVTLAWISYKLFAGLELSASDRVLAGIWLLVSTLDQVIEVIDG